MIKKIHIENYKSFGSFTLDFNDDLNIIVGDNEVGKSTILEAINLALTKRLNGKLIENELSPYLFNKACVASFLKSLGTDSLLRPPKIIIELYLSDDEEKLQTLRGANNTDGSNSLGVRLEIVFDDEYNEEYAKMLQNIADIKIIPTEFYKVNWYSFANKPMTVRGLPIGLSFIDATTMRLQSGTDYYLQNIINNGLDAKERVELSVAYRKLKEKFSSEPSIQIINTNLTQKKGVITDKDLAISIDISQKSNWETNLVPHLDELPFQLVGKGEQNALKIMLALERKANDSHIILIEEPENHLSFSSMNKLISKIKDKCTGKQIFITTHNAYVLNSLGLEALILLSGNKAIFLKDLPADTQNYFKKLSGYDTLRLILAKRTILVEGPSDELLIQKAYLLKHGKLPIENGVDVLNVRGLSFTRFLDIAKELEREVAVVTDNDGNHQENVVDTYSDYTNSGNITVYADSDNSSPTLEPQIIKNNDLAKLNKVFGTKHKDVQSLTKYMEQNKTECALKIFETEEDVKIPQYIKDAIEQE